MSWVWYADVGNCTVHWGAWAEQQWQASDRLAVDPLGSQQANDLLLTALQEAGLKIADCEKAVLCISSPVRRTLAEQFAVNQLETDVAVAGDDFPVEVATDYYDPTQIGTDRLLNALAAIESVGKPCVVVDFGSCLTCDAVTREGVLTAGAIAPGLPIMQQGLISSIPHLGDAVQEALEQPGSASPAGRSTAEGLSLGLIQGLAGMADRLVSIMHQKVGRKASVVATGGDMHLVMPHCEARMIADEMLTLDGLRLAYEALADRANSGDTEEDEGGPPRD